MAPELRATYRLQLGQGLGFREARALVPYLEELGVSHLYLSPSLQARAGSTHGYDVVDPKRLSEELGGEEEFRALCAGGLGVVLDIVPNHMAASAEENPFWRDPLWRAKFFDLDWRTGAHRRFFDVGELAGVRVEDPEVFEQTHAKVLSLVREGVVDGLRIDHPDGLANPARYLERLREAGAGRVWVEKILEPGEHLRDWPVEGTTGYEFLNDVTALFVDPAGEEPLTGLYADLTGERRPFGEVARECKLREAETTFADEAERLAALLLGVEKVPDTFSTSGAAARIGGVEKVPDTFSTADMAAQLASLHVYRTYVDPDRGLVADADRDAVAAAGLHERLARILLLEERGHDAFVVRFQQTTPPVHAKGVEDTAFYRWHRLVALNEVGGDPSRFSLPVDDFHRANLERAERFPLHLLSTMTHDAKRSADVRARIGALSLAPRRWASFAERWLEGAPDPNDGYLILQTVFGAWPGLTRERLAAYLTKALREAKVHTNWLQPDDDFERQAIGWAASLVEDGGFRAELEALEHDASLAIHRATTGQALLKLTCPGVPDLYGGDEVPFFALVDPDNRRPVDWDALRRAHPQPGAKLDVIRRTLALRRERPSAFAGDYEPLEAGPDVCAFTRDGAVLVAVAMRGDLSAFRPPPGRWHDLIATPYLRLASA